MSPTVLDTLIQVETPEAIDIQLRPASMFQRIIAFSLDLLIRSVWFIVSTIAMVSLFGNISVAFESENFSYMALGFLLINLFATTWLYPVLFEVFNHGRTPGKMAAKIRVLHDNGSPIGWSASMLRNLLRVFDGLPFAYAIGMVSMLLSPKGQRIGDVFAGTIVVDEHTERQNGRLAYLEHIPSVTPPVMLTREEQYSIVSFTERHPRLPRVRQQELAEQLCYDLQMPSTNPIETVLGMGKYYLGQQQKDAA